MSADFNAGLVEEINFLRTNPRRYASKVQNYTKYFKGKILRLPGTNAGIKTIEGADAYREAVDYLSKHSRIEAFTASKGMCKIAEEILKEAQVRDLGELNTIDVESIIAKYGAFNGNFSRAIDFGGETPEQVLINLLVCDGDPSRGQRDSLLSTDLKVVGIANGRHNTYRRCTVVVSCTQFYNAHEKDDLETFGQTGKNDEEEEQKEEQRKEERVEEEANNENNEDSNVLKPRRVIMSGMGGNNNIGKKDEKLPPGVVAINRSEKIVIEGGRKQKVVKIIKEMEDGTKEMETVREDIDE